ncbi:MAG: nuclear transport factor 2 family protein [Saprospiraceae bacterium]|nr:nuclear transport factor 2 family protein [Saprospiraceae bacterium]
MKSLQHSLFLFTILVMLVAVSSVSYAQDAESLKATIQKHYHGINTGDLDEVMSHHLPEFSMFGTDGHALLESGWQETASNMGTEIIFGELQVTMKHFSAQIYDNMGIAMFYLDGLMNGESKTTRVTAVWIWRNGEWREAHHHESPLKS